MSAKFGLYHVNPMTDEVVPYNDPSAHGLTRDDAEQRLKDIQIGIGRGTAHRDHWITEAREDR